jgi:hypothetical protein
LARDPALQLFGGQQASDESADVTLGTTPRAAFRITGRGFSRRGRRTVDAEKRLATLEVGRAVGEETVVANALKSLGEDMKQEAPNELVGIEGHHLGAVAIAVVLPPEPYEAVLIGDEPAVGDGHAVGVASEIAQDLLRPAKRPFRVDDPIRLVGRSKTLLEGSRVFERCELALKLELPVGESLPDLVEEFASKDPREDLDREEEVFGRGDPSLAVEGKTATGYDAVDVWMMEKVLPPCVKHRQKPDASAEVFRISGDHQEGLGGGTQESAVDDLLVLKGDLGKKVGNREDDMEVTHG